MGLGMSLEMKTDVAITEVGLQAALQARVEAKYQIIQVVFNSTSSTYTIISQKNNIS